VAVYRLTGSSLLLGVVGFASQIPVFLLSPVGGVVADRYRRHRIVVVTQSSAMTLAFILAAITLLTHIRVWQIILLATLLGLVNAFDVPARQAFVVELVPSADLINAIALNSSMVNGARILGPAIAGVVVAAIGEGWCFLVNGLSYIAVITCLLLMVLTPRDGHRTAPSALESIKEGFRFVGKTGPIRALLLLLGLVSLTGMPYTVLMPIFAGTILHSGAQGLGWLMGASGVGALAGTLTLAARKGIRGLGRWITYAAAGFGGAMIVFSLSRSFVLSVALLVPVGFSMMLQMASSNTLIQTMVPDVLRGRVMAFYGMMLMGMAPFGSLIAGAVASKIGAPLTVTFGGFTCLGGALIFGWRWPGLRGEARQLILAQAMASGEPPEDITGQAMTLEAQDSQ
jgi:MFS family permease